MKKIFNSALIFVVIAAMFCMVACGCDSDNCCDVEAVSLETVVFNEIEFKNNDNVEFEQKCDDVYIAGTIDAMSDAQKSAFGDNDVTHYIALKILFDKERTIASFKIQGEKIKVFSTNEEDENYVGSLSDLLDNESGEDAYAYLILSANTKNYTLTTKYTDGHQNDINIEISATLATAGEN